MGYCFTQTPTNEEAARQALWRGRVRTRTYPPYALLDKVYQWPDGTMVVWAGKGILHIAVRYGELSDLPGANVEVVKWVAASPGATVRI